MHLLPANFLPVAELTGIALAAEHAYDAAAAERTLPAAEIARLAHAWRDARKNLDAARGAR